MKNSGPLDSVPILKSNLASITVLLMCMTVGCPAYAERPLPQRQLKTYVLHENPTSADISPDESFVVTEIRRWGHTEDPAISKVSDLVQVWDFRKDKLVAERVLWTQKTDRREPTSRFFADFPLVRYSADGKTVIAYSDSSLYVLRADNLDQIKQIPLTRSPAESRTYKDRQGVHTFVTEPHVVTLEASPTRHEVAVIWEVQLSNSWIDVVDLDSAKQTLWGTKERGFLHTARTLRWTSDGEHLVVAAPDHPCGRPGNTPDVFVVNPSSGVVERKLSTGLLVGDIAVTADGRLFAVDYDCADFFTNRAPKLRVFDLHTGKKIRELPGRGTGVRYAVSVSQNGNRLAAYTGIRKQADDWASLEVYEKNIDSTFTVWNATNYDVLVTSQNVAASTLGPILVGNRIPLRMSSKGGLVLMGGAIYEVP